MPLPLQQDLYDRLAGARCFSALDLTETFHQLRLDPAVCELTAFHGDTQGLFKYNVVPYCECSVCTAVLS